MIKTLVENITQEKNPSWTIHVYINEKEIKEIKRKTQATPQEQRK